MILCLQEQSALFRPRACRTPLCRGSTRHKRVSDATFASLRQHFSENEIVELTWLNAVHNYYNLINLPLEIESDGLCAIAQNQMPLPKTISIGYKHPLTPASSCPKQWRCFNDRCTHLRRYIGVANRFPSKTQA